MSSKHSHFADYSSIIKGGDEVVADCWKYDKSIWQWAQQNNLTDVWKIYQYFERRLVDIVMGKDSRGKLRLFFGRCTASSTRNWMMLCYSIVKKTMMVWQDAFDDAGNSLVDKDIVIQVWLDKNSVKSAVQSGYRAVLSQPYYLDRQVRLSLMSITPLSTRLHSPHY